MGGVTYISPAKRNESGNVLSKPITLKGWHCDLCPATGEEPSSKGAQRAWDRHFMTVHYGKDTD